MPLGWKGLFKRLAGTAVSPVSLRPVRSSASLTIQPVLATLRPDPKTVLQQLEMSPDKAAQARSVAEQSVSTIESLLQERQRSHQQTPLTQLPPTPTPPVSYALSAPPHSGVSYTSLPSSVQTSSACLETSAALVTIVPSGLAVHTSQAGMRTSAAVVTVAPSDLESTSPVSVTAFPVSACTPRSRTASRLGSLAQIKEDSKADSQDDAKSRITAESIAASDAEDDVQSRLRASWAGRVSGGSMAQHTPPQICEERAGGPGMKTTAIDVEEIELGVPSSAEQWDVS